MARGTKKSDWMVAFDADGHVSYDGYPYGSRDYMYVAADHEFKDTLRSEGDWDKGRSSVTAFVYDSTGVRYTMKMANFMKLVPRMVNGEVYGTWGFEKNGANTFLVECE